MHLRKHILQPMYTITDAARRDVHSYEKEASHIFEVAQNFAAQKAPGQ